MLSVEAERLQRRADAKAEALAARDALRDKAGYPAPVQRNAVGEAEVTVEEEDSEEVNGYAVLTKDELINELKERELPHTGKKDELIARLEEDDAAQSE